MGQTVELLGNFINEIDIVFIRKHFIVELAATTRMAKGIWLLPEIFLVLVQRS